MRTAHHRRVIAAAATTAAAMLAALPVPPATGWPPPPHSRYCSSAGLTSVSWHETQVGFGRVRHGFALRQCRGKRRERPFHCRVRVSGQCFGCLQQHSPLPQGDYAMEGREAASLSGPPNRVANSWGHTATHT